MAWYKQNVCAYPYLSWLHNFLTCKLDRKYKPFSVTLPTQVPPGYLVGTSARDLRLYLSVSPVVPSFNHPAMLAVPKWGPKPSQARMTTTIWEATIQAYTSLEFSTLSGSA